MNEAVFDKQDYNVRDEHKHYDATEQDSKRGDEKATEIARKLENDDMGGVSSPEGDNDAENKVETSLDEEW